jgi:hypothetical protein
VPLGQVTLKANKTIGRNPSLPFFFLVIQVTDDEEEESEFLSARLPEIGFGFGTEISDGSSSVDRETSTTSNDGDEDRSAMVLIKPNLIKTQLSYKPL